MIEIEIPKDVKEYEPKLIGNFTSRQVIALACVALISGLGYKIIGNFTESGLRVLIPLVLDIPFALFGWYKPYGMKFEKYAKVYIYTNILPPKHRKYKIENIYDEFDKQIEAEEKKASVEAKNNNSSTPKKKKGGKS